MNIAIVDDEQVCRDQLVRFIANYAKEKNENFEVDVFDNGKSFLASCRARKYDIVFMDIILPEYDGLEVSHRFREIDQYAALIFVTNMAQYAINGYEVAALDFLVKPITYTNFCLKMTKALKYVYPRKSREILLKATSGTMYRISVLEICYVESFAHYLEYHIVDNQTQNVMVIKVRGNMSAAERELDSKLIIRCHKSLLVNLLHIIKVDGTTVFVKDDVSPRCVPISRTYKADFMKKLLELYRT